MEKQITFKLVGPEGSHIVGDELTNLLIGAFGCDAKNHITEDQVKELFGEMKDGETYEYKILIEKKYTQEDLEKMPESDGDIH